MKQVQISTLKSELSKHLRAAEAGEVIEVMDRARAIARVVPIGSSGGLETAPAERPFSAVRRVRFPPANLRVGSLEALANERGTR
jgi:prevent-host-death family protein